MNVMITIWHDKRDLHWVGVRDLSSVLLFYLLNIEYRFQIQSEKILIPLPSFHISRL
jgi:hypothetical protein